LSAIAWQVAATACWKVSRRSFFGKVATAGYIKVTFAVLSGSSTPKQRW
jgi:hypothetical protein